MKPARFVALFVGAGLGAAVVSAGQLTERPLIRALAHPAIEYYTRPTHDLVAELKSRIEDGTAQIPFDESTGYLRPVLDALHLPVESQMLVMSKTGVQGLYTGPSNPRAIYFNDAVTVGYIKGAPLLEFAVEDPEQGVIFYTLDQKPQQRPVIERKPACLSCHQVYSTLHVPGMLTRSVFMAPDGLPLSQFGSYDADDRTPFRRRWGGWYVTGTHGAMRHIGNAVVTDREKRDVTVSDSTLHPISLEATFDGRGYLSTHSDIVALMVFAHQSHMTNLITRIGWEARIAAAAAPDHRADLSTGSLRDGVIELVDYLFFVDEDPLAAPVRGTSGFAETFAAQGPADSRGRSLRQFDLERRLLKYPCSYMIYSAAFRALPAAVRMAIYGRMGDVLSGRDPNPKYARLSGADRRAIVEILRETVPDLPNRFSAATDGAQVNDSLSSRALRVLRDALDKEDRWIKVHAAEALLAVGRPDGVLRAFESELTSKGAEAKYRIGIWRVLAQSTSEHEREQWVGKILTAFLDTDGPDRLHAAETLAKLGYHARGREADAFEIVARTRRGSLAVDAQWVLVNSGPGNNVNGEMRLAELLDSDDDGTRDDAAYAIRHLPKLSSAAWEKLAAAAKREPAHSGVRANLMSAAFLHAPPGENAQKASFKAELVKYAQSGTTDEKFEACAVLGQAGESDVLPLLAGLLESHDPDVRVGAAQAILRIGRP
ncbi:MAG: HEAT repeat domain-containing protein [Acidobacteriia bacterium]|nr:HEAT repeat domain-containing protein [Terriglobia bacterium]